MPSGDPRDFYLNRLGAAAGATYDPNEGRPAGSGAAALDLAGADISTNDYTRTLNAMQTQQMESGSFGSGVAQNIGNFFSGVGDFVEDVWDDAAHESGANPFHWAEVARRNTAYWGGRVWDNAGLDSAANQVLNAIVTAGRGIATPFAAANVARADTLDSTADDFFSRSVEDWKNYFDSETWSKAWESTDPELKEATSPGRAVADFFLVSETLGAAETQELAQRGYQDPTNAEWQQYRSDSSVYNMTSGVADVAYAFALAPEVLALKGLGGASRVAQGKTTLMNAAQRKRFTEIALARGDRQRLAEVGYRPGSLFDMSARHAGRRLEALRQTIRNDSSGDLYERLSRMPFARHTAQGDAGASAYLVEYAAKSADDELWDTVIRASVGGDEMARDALRLHADREVADAMDAIARPLAKETEIFNATDESIALLDGWKKELAHAGQPSDWVDELKVLEQAKRNAARENIMALKQDAQASQALTDMLYKAAGADFAGHAPAGRAGTLMDMPLDGTGALREAMRSTYVYSPTKHAGTWFRFKSHSSRIWKRQPGVIDLHRGTGAVENATAYLDQVERWASKTLDESWVTRRNDLLRNLGAAQTDVQRRAAVMEIENEAIQRLGAQHGLDWEDVADLKKWLDDRKLAAQAALEDPAHQWHSRGPLEIDGVKVDFSAVDLGDGMGVQKLPVLTSQLQNWHTSVDLATLNKFLRIHSDDVKHILKKERARRSVSDIAATGTSLLDSYNHVWKFSVLLRLGYPIRTVGDDGMRTLAAGAGLSTFLEMTHGPQIANRLGPKLKGQRAIKVNGKKVVVAEALSGPEASVYRKLASSEASWGKFYGVYVEQLHHQRAVGINSVPAARPAATGLFGGEAYSKAWAKNMTDQVLTDPVSRMLIDGMEPQDVARWLRTTDEGADYLARHPHYLDGVNGGKTADEIVEMIDDHWRVLAPTEDLKQLARDYLHGGLADKPREFQKRLDEILTNMSDEDFKLMVPVHFETSSMITGTGPGAKAFRTMTNGIFNVLQKLPNDTLVRNPFFRAQYKRRLNEILSQREPGTLTKQIIGRAERDAREYALSRLNRYLFSLNEETEFLHMVRNLVPFGTAHIEALKKWGQVALDNPVGAYRVWGLGWGGLGDLYFIDEVDRDGNPIPGGQKWTNDSYLRFRVPDEMISFLPHLKAFYNEKGEVYGQIAKGSTNLIMQGEYPFIPSVGPVVQIPAGWWFKANPQFATDEHGISRKFFNYLFPIGLPQNTGVLGMLEQVLPTSMNKVMDAARNDPAFLATETQIIKQYLANFQQANHRAPSKGEAAELMRRAEHHADWVRRYYFLGSLILPANISYLPGDQELIEQARRLRQEDPVNWYSTFVDKFGWEAAVMGQSLSTSTNKVPSTGIGELDYQRNAALIQDYPELGSILVSPAAFLDDYEQAVYRVQQQRPTGPGRPEPQRSYANPIKAITESQTRQAWEEYGQLQDLVRAELVARFGEGASLNIKDAEGLRVARAEAVADLARRFPAWEEEYFQRDTGWGLRFVESSKAMLADLEEKDPGFRTYMPWLAGLEEYIEVHDMVVDELKKRKAAGGASTLYSSGSGNLNPTQGNEDLAAAWEAAIAHLTQSNPSFASHVYDRNLDGWAPIVGTGR